MPCWRWPTTSSSASACTRSCSWRSPRRRWSPSLTILGFSLYDTIVVFDKVKENQAAGLANRTTRHRPHEPVARRQTLMRSVNTTLVTIVPVLSILLIGAVLLGAVTSRSSAALLIGRQRRLLLHRRGGQCGGGPEGARARNKTAARKRLEKAYDGEVPVTGIRHVNPASLRAAAATAGARGPRRTGGTVPVRAAPRRPPPSRPARKKKKR